MQNPLVRRAIGSFLTTLAGLGLVYYLIAIFPSPRLWLANATANSGMLVMALVMLILYGLPAWALVYLGFGLLGIPNLERPGRGRSIGDQSARYSSRSSPRR